MGRLSQELDSFHIIGLDTSVFIYHFEANPTYVLLTQEILSGIEEGRWYGVASILALMEISVRPWILKREDVVRKYEALLFNFPNFDLIEIDRQVAHLAAYLRAGYSLKPADALQIASCLKGNAECFLTNDHRLKKLQSRLPVLLLDDFVE